MAKQFQSIVDQRRDEWQKQDILTMVERSDGPHKVPVRHANLKIDPPRIQIIIVVPPPVVEGES